MDECVRRREIDLQADCEVRSANIVDARELTAQPRAIEVEELVARRFHERVEVVQQLLGVDVDVRQNETFIAQSLHDAVRVTALRDTQQRAHGWR